MKTVIQRIIELKASYSLAYHFDVVYPWNASDVEIDVDEGRSVCDGEKKKKFMNPKTVVFNHDQGSIL